MAVLTRLAKADGHVVSRSELFDDVWPRAEVTDAVLTQCIVELRKALGDSAREPRYIETIPKVGFRLLAPITAHTEEAPISDPYSGKSSWPYWPIGLAILLTLAIVVRVIDFIRDDNDLRDVVAVPVSSDTPLVVVLPFRDLSPDSSQAWFANGLTSDINSLLVRMDGLSVIGRQSADQFGAVELNTEEIRQQLNVDYVLYGSTRLYSDLVRINVDLIDTSNGVSIWADTFDRPVEDMFDVQTDIARSVYDALSIKLGVGYYGTISGGTDHVEAHMLVMRAWDQYEEGAEGYIRAIDMMERAVELDPNYARGWLALAQLYHMAPGYLSGVVSLDWDTLWLDAIQHAQAITPNDVEVIGKIVQQQASRGQWIELSETLSSLSEQQIQGDAVLMFSLSLAMMHTGRVSEALELGERVYVLEPRASQAFSVLGYAYLYNGKVKRALEEFEHGYALDRNQRLVALGGLTAAMVTRDPVLIRHWLQLVMEAGELPPIEGMLPAMVDRLDDPAAALSWLHEAFERTESMDYFITLWAAYFGDVELALDAQHRTPDTWAFWNPLMSEARKSPRFIELIEQIGLPQFWRDNGWSDFCSSGEFSLIECD
jgi:TolB-like protein